MKTIIQWFIGLSITALAIFGYGLDIPMIHRLEMLFQNAHFQHRGSLSSGPEVVIAAIDEKSIDELGRWPWPRKELAELIDKLVELDARVIGLDMVFSSPDKSSGTENLRALEKELSPWSQGDPEFHQTFERFIIESDSDAQFAQALEASGRSVLGYFFHFNSQGLDHLTKKIKHENFENIKKSQFKGFIKSAGEISLRSIPFRQAYAVESNIPVLSEISKSSGFISMDVEADGSIRKLPLIVNYYD